jgi:hypothetical protein
MSSWGTFTNLTDLKVGFGNDPKLGFLRLPRSVSRCCLVKKDRGILDQIVQNIYALRRINCSGVSTCVEHIGTNQPDLNLSGLFLCAVLGCAIYTGALLGHVTTGCEGLDVIGQKYPDHPV